MQYLKVFHLHWFSFDGDTDSHTHGFFIAHKHFSLKRIETFFGPPVAPRRGDSGVWVYLHRCFEEEQANNHVRVRRWGGWVEWMGWVEGWLVAWVGGLSGWLVDRRTSAWLIMANERTNDVFGFDEKEYNAARVMVWRRFLCLMTCPYLSDYAAWISNHIESMKLTSGACYSCCRHVKCDKGLRWHWISGEQPPKPLWFSWGYYIPWNPPCNTGHLLSARVAGYCCWTFILLVGVALLSFKNQLVYVIVTVLGKHIAGIWHTICTYHLYSYISKHIYTYLVVQYTYICIGVHMELLYIYILLHIVSNYIYTCMYIYIYSCVHVYTLW